MSELLAAADKPMLKAPKRMVPVAETEVPEVASTEPEVAPAPEIKRQTVWRLERHPIPGGHLLHPFSLLLSERARCLGVFGEHSYDMMVLTPLGDDPVVERTFVQVRGNGTLRTPPEVRYVGRYAQYGTQAVAVFELVA